MLPFLLRLSILLSLSLLRLLQATFSGGPWIHTNTRDFEGEFEIPGYKTFKKDRLDREGGGVMLYVRGHLDPVECKIETEHEMVGVVLNKLEKKLHIYLVYRPPHQSAESDESLYSNLSTIIRNKFCIVAGDFNCSVNWKTQTADAESMRLLDFTNEEYLTQWVDKPTRGNNTLDLVFSSEDNMISKLSVGEKLGKSDHNMIRFEILTSFTKLEKSFMKPNFRKADFSRLRCEIRRLPKSGGTDAEQNWFSFKTEFMKAQSCCIPQRKITPNGTKQPEWFNKSIAEAISNRQKAYNISKLRPSPETKAAHIKECRNVDKLIRRAKLNEEDRVAAAAKYNPKAFFAHVNSRKPVKNTIGPLKDKTGSIISSDEGMANILNEYFTSVYTEEDTSEIPIVPIVYRGNNPLRKIEITVDKVKMKLKKLNSNKSAGPDGFYPRVIKETEEETAPHFCNIFRTSLEQRKAVRDWKLQNISPLFKKGSKDDPGNYRPICLTNLVDFFHDMFSIYDKSRAVDILYLDFRKAFDKVPHKRLMAKVRSLGIIDEVGDWIEDWLSDRKQRVVINGTSSGWRDVTSGVPQGSVLGPLLFIIYINDLDLVLVSKISKFADDTRMGINADSDAAVKQLQEDLRKVGEWSKKWQMPFNLDKCKIMHIGHKNKNEKYELLGKEIESVQQEKDLGVVITNDLKSSNQCIEAVKKAQKLLGYIKRQFRTRNKETILTLYNALVRPHLEYAVQFWSPSLRKDIERLEAVQARATKLIPSIRHLGYVRRLERLNLYSLEKRRLRGQLIETFKMLKGVNNIDYRHLCTFSNNRTRSNGWKLELKRFNTSQCGNFFTYKIAPIWNRLPAEAVNSASVEHFKIELDKVIDTLI